MPLWSLCQFANCLDDACVVQREYKGWVVHHYEGDVYHASYFFDATTELKLALSKFLLLADWKKGIGDPQDLNLWPAIFQSRSPAYLAKISADDIAHTHLNYIEQIETDDL